MGVGLQIKEYIKDNGIKQKYLAKVTKISEPKLNLALNEKRHLKFEEYEVICWALNIGTDKFLSPHKPHGKNEEKVS